MTPEQTRPREIKMNRGIVLVDAADYESLIQYTWFERSGYASAVIEGKMMLMHRYLLKPESGLMVDHINRNTLDNRRCNLRTATALQNLANRGPVKNSSSKYRGVTLAKKGRVWQAAIKINGKSKRIGGYRTEEEAAAAWNIEALNVFGEYAYQNPVNVENPTRIGQRDVSGLVGYRGVFTTARGKGEYTAKAEVKGERFTFGGFRTAMAAAYMYDWIVRSRGGEGSRLNFPDDDLTIALSIWSEDMHGRHSRSFKGRRIFIDALPEVQAHLSPTKANI